MFEALNEFIAIVAGEKPWLLLLVVPLVWWGYTNWQVLNAPEKKESFDWAIKQLKENNWGRLYLNALGRLLDKVSDWIGDRDNLNQIYVTPANPGGIIHKTFGFNPFTPESYDKCLRLAFLYPTLSFFISWVIGGDGRVGNLNFFYSTEISLDSGQFWRWIILAVIVSFLLLIYRALRVKNSKNMFYIFTILVFSLAIDSTGDAIYNGMSFLVTFLLVFFSVFLGGMIVVVKFPLLMTTKGILVFAFEFAIILCFSDVVSSSVALMGLSPDGYVVIAVLMVGLVFNSRLSLSRYYIAYFSLVFFSSIGLFDGVFFVGLIYYDLFNAGNYQSVDAYVLAMFVFGWCFGVGFIFVLIDGVKDKKILIVLVYLIYFLVGYIYFLPEYTNPLSMRMHEDRLITILLCFVLPLVNAPLDWLSLGVTRGLLQAARAGHHGGWSALGFGLLDLVFALVFLFLIAAVLVVATALGNVVAGETLVDLGVIFAGLRADPWSVNHWWVYFMMLSTLVPTLVHFALAGGAATLWLPQRWREQIAHNLEQNHYKTSAAWVFLTFTPAIGFVLAPALLMWGLYAVVAAHGGWLGGHLLDWAEWLALVVNPHTSAGVQP